MSTVEVISFRKALKAVPTGTQPHVLLGNGFSRALKDDIFSYQALFEQAKDAGLTPDALKTFKALATTDFEQVMRFLIQAAKLVHAYGKPNFAKKLRAQADRLREILVRTIAANHPARPQEVEPFQYEACKKFLNNFKSIYTVNYDLLLYWTVMQDEVGPQVNCDDGFREPYTGKEEYVTWEVEHTNKQCIYYLHGALHLFDAGFELQKFTWSNTQIALIDQIRKALQSDRYPLFVSEGTAKSKLDRIQHSGYLNRSYRSFANIGGALFIFGLSMSEQDEHILRLLDRTNCKLICVSLFGPPDSRANRAIVERTRQMRPRKRSGTLDFMFYDAQSAKVWG